ncbi:MAG TPA: zinc ribbon domain-containing protein [Gammaproteobacteria bacterium]|nr:zinc ribbon domain-containing protein [Gammaproteobacteria bacterium]
MNTVCKHCGKPIPDNSRFCNHCGQPQEGNKSLEEKARETCVQIIRELNEEALEAKHKLLEEFQDKATKWVKTQFIAATTAISVVLAVLAYAGFSGFDASERFKQAIEKSTLEFEQNLEANKKYLAASDKKIKATMNNFNKRAANIDRMLEEKTQQIENLNTENINRYQQSLNEMMHSLKSLADRYDLQQKKIRTQLADIEKLKNSQFQILVHYRDDSIDDYQRNVKRLTDTLDREGYVVNERNIANVSVDRQEILYYSKATRIINKVNEIQQLLKDNLGRTLPLRFEGAGDFNPLRIAIKLCARKSLRNGRCQETGNKGK